MGVALLVDDDLDILDLMTLVLQEAGWKTVAAGSGAAAWRALEGLQAAGWGPDLVVLDLDLPDMPGEAVLHGLRERAAQALPVLVTSGCQRCGERARAMGVPWLKKPFDLQDLVRRAEELVRQGQATRPGPPCAAP